MGYLGLFGELGVGDWPRVVCEVRDLGLVDVDIKGSGDHVGGLVGFSYNGSITTSCSTGVISGNSYVGGLVGYNTHSVASITRCYSAGKVSGAECVGGLVGLNIGSVTPLLQHERDRRCVGRWRPCWMQSIDVFTRGSRTRNRLLQYWGSQWN
jgi:hypothetical protein